jgi:hypothetical protein
MLWYKSFYGYCCLHHQVNGTVISEGSGRGKYFGVFAARRNIPALETTVISSKSMGYRVFQVPDCLLTALIQII